MAEVKKHYNPSTGLMEKCNAKSGNCPFGAHYTNDVEGQDYADEQNRLEANREKYVKEQPVEYEKHHQNMIANLYHDYDKNWENTKYKDLDDFIKVEQENTKIYEEEIRRLQDGSSELRYIGKDVGYPHPVEIKGDLSEKEIDELIRKREAYVVGMLKGTLSKDIRTPSYMPFMVNGGLNKENIQKELDTDKKVIKYDNLKSMRSMLKGIEGFKKSTKLSDKNYTDTENGAMTINSLDYALNNMGYASSRLGDKEININEGYENENYKVTFQKNGAMKINFKKKDIPEKLNKFRSEYLRESDGPLNQFKPKKLVDKSFGNHMPEAERNAYRNLINDIDNMTTEDANQFLDNARVDEVLDTYRFTTKKDGHEYVIDTFENTVTIDNNYKETIPMETSRYLHNAQLYKDMGGQYEPEHIDYSKTNPEEDKVYKDIMNEMQSEIENGDFNQYVADRLTDRSSSVDEYGTSSEIFTLNHNGREVKIDTGYNVMQVGNHFQSIPLDYKERIVDAGNEVDSFEQFYD